MDRRAFFAGLGAAIAGGLVLGEAVAGPTRVRSYSFPASSWVDENGVMWSIAEYTHIYSTDVGLRVHAGVSMIVDPSLMQIEPGARMSIVGRHGTVRRYANPPSLCGAAS